MLLVNLSFVEKNCSSISIDASCTRYFTIGIGQIFMFASNVNVELVLLRVRIYRGPGHFT